MSSLNKLKHLDYAVYGKVIVPLINFGPETWFQILDDVDAGICRMECRRRKPKKIPIRTVDGV